MKKIFPILFLLILASPGYGQPKHKISTILSFQYSHTTRDITLRNNPSGMGLELQAFYHNSSIFTPTIEITGDIYLGGYDVLYMDNKGNPIDGLGSVAHVFAGSSFKIVDHISASIMAGPAFLLGRTLFGVKPSLAIYFPKSQRWRFAFSYVNIFNRYQPNHSDFRSLVYSMGIRLF